jgi:hypothetical protein
VNGNYFSCQTDCAQQGNHTPLFNYADTVSWTTGKHGFKGGGDIRITYPNGYETPTAPIPKATGGAGLGRSGVSQQSSIPGLVANNETIANQMLYFLAGSLNNAQQYYYIERPDQLTKWSSYLDHTRKVTDAHQNDFSVFFERGRYVPRLRSTLECGTSTTACHMKARG